MTVYVRRNGRLVDRRTGEPMLRANETRGLAMPHVRGDLPDYVSPLGSGVISGRAARREDLKRHGCREVDPSEYTPEYRNARLERRYSGGLPDNKPTCQS